MNLMDISPYRVKTERSYYERGYYLADVISMHRCFASLNNASDDIELDKLRGEIGGIVSYLNGEGGDNSICYDPMTLFRCTRPNELMYIAAHETAHIIHNDGIRIRTMNRLLCCFGVCLFIITSYVCIPLVVFIPILIYFMNLTSKREIETQADLKALEFISLDTVLAFIGNRGARNRFDWLFYDHATKVKLSKKVQKLS